MGAKTNGSDRNLTETEKAYEALETMVVIGQLAPGSLHTERELGQLLDLGRTPVREALQKLAHEGLIEIQSRRGIQVPTISAEDQLKLLKVRRAVEAICVQEACENASETQRSELAALSDSLPLMAENVENRTDFLRTLRSAHEALTDAAENPFLISAMRPVQGLSRRFWFFNATFDDYRKAAGLHAAILRAVSMGDQVAARAASDALIDYLEAFTRSTCEMRPTVD